MRSQEEANARFRASAHVLLDAVAAFDHEAGETPENEAAVGLALGRLQEVEGITLLRDDETDELTIDAAPVLGASMHMLTMLIHMIAEDRRLDPLAVLSVVRDQMEANYSTD